MTITKRIDKGSALTYQEFDENFRDLLEDTDLARVLGNGNTADSDMTLNGTLTVTTLEAGSLALSLSSLSDVSDTAPENDDVLKWNGSSWAPGNAADMSGSGVLRLPTHTTAERDALAAQNGDIIYNTTANKFQGYANGAWVDLH